LHISAHLNLNDHRKVRLRTNENFNYSKIEGSHRNRISFFFPVTCSSVPHIQTLFTRKSQNVSSTCPPGTKLNVHMIWAFCPLNANPFIFEFPKFALSILDFLTQFTDLFVYGWNHFKIYHLKVVRVHYFFFCQKFRRLPDFGLDKQTENLNCKSVFTSKCICLCWQVEIYDIPKWNE
jgi:hypothetical protein